MCCWAPHGTPLPHETRRDLFVTLQNSASKRRKCSNWSQRCMPRARPWHNPLPPPHRPLVHFLAVTHSPYFSTAHVFRKCRFAASRRIDEYLVSSPSSTTRMNASPLLTHTISATGSTRANTWCPSCTRQRPTSPWRRLQLRMRRRMQSQRWRQLPKASLPTASLPTASLPRRQQALQEPLRASRSGEPVLARPTGCDGRVGSRGRLCEAALGDAGSHHTSSGVYYKVCHRCKRPCARSYCGLARGSMMSRGSGSTLVVWGP